MCNIPETKTMQVLNFEVLPITVCILRYKRGAREQMWCDLASQTG